MSKEEKLVFVFLDTDKHVSAFDTLLTIDLFPDAKILHYPGVGNDDASRIITDSMFPRGSSGAPYTKIFLGGSDVDAVERILQTAKKAMFPPFELSVIVDPRGAYTTASAAVAKTVSMTVDSRFENMKGRNVTILAGTGPVGGAAAYLYAAEGASVRITSRSAARAGSVSSRINSDLGSNLVTGVEAIEYESVGGAVAGSEVILAAGAPGIQLLKGDILRRYGNSCRVVADVNAVPPSGIEGLTPEHNGEDVGQGIRGIGALSIGRLKIKVESELIREAVEAKKGIFDFKAAYRIAKSISAKK